MRFSKIAIIYFVMGAVVLSTGVVPPASQGGPGIGITGVFLDVEDGQVSTNKSTIGGVAGGDDDGMLDGLIGPVKNALDTITGGALLAVWGPLNKMIGAYAYPVVVMNYLGAPDIVVLLAGTLPTAFTLGVLRVFRSSI